MTTKILTQAQAEAVYSAMCHLNNVGGQMNASFEGGAVSAIEWSEGTVTVTRHRAPAGFPYCNEQQETYSSQSAFATAYGLQQG